MVKQMKEPLSPCLTIATGSSSSSTPGKNDPMASGSASTSAPSTAASLSAVPSSGPMEEFRIVMQSYPIGGLMMACALVLHYANNFGLLWGYCSELGCFRPGCTGLLPNQCLPPMSNTYIVFYPDGSFWQYCRRAIMLVTCLVRTCVEPAMISKAHWLLVNREGVWRRSERQMVFTSVMWFQAALDVLSIIFWNTGPLKIVHTILSFVLIFVWVCFPPLWIMALRSSGGARELCSSWAIVAILMLGFASAVKLSFWSDSKAWDWYLWEWICISCQGLGLLVAGAGLPSSYRLKRCKYPTGASRWEAEVEEWSSRHAMDRRKYSRLDEADIEARSAAAAEEACE